MKYTVKQARVLADFTQTKMEKMLGISRDTYRKIELDPESAKISQAKKISKITGIEFSDIFMP